MLDEQSATQRPTEGSEPSAANLTGVDLLERRIQTVCLIILSAVALGGTMYWLKPVMIPFVLALFIALGLNAVINMQMDWMKIPRPLALLSTLMLAFLIFTVLAALVTASVGQLADNAAAYVSQFTKLLERMGAVLPGDVAAFTPEGVTERLSQISVTTVSGMLLTTTNAILSTLSQSFLVFIFSLYLVLGGGSSSQRLAGEAWLEVESRVTRYIVYKTIISAGTGFVVWCILAVLGIDLALVFGLFAFMLNFIPSVGSIIATLLPLPVVIVNPEISTTVAVLAIVLPAAVQLTVGNFIEPMIMGDSLDLHPVVVLLSLIFWGMLWGVVGMLLATPITAILKIMFSRLEPTRAFSEALAGRFAVVAAPPVRGE
jgi:AI-2 transport protein TqsA